MKQYFSNLPKDWMVECLDLLAKRGSGHTPDKSVSSYWDGEVKWVSLTDSGKLDNGYIYDTAKKISQEGIDNSSAVLHPAGTVILSRDAGVGKSAVLAVPMAVSQHFMAWRCKADRLNNWFLYYWLQLLKPEFERQAVGSTIITIGLPYFKRMRIPCPPLSEQILMARIFQKADEEISLLSQKIRLKHEQKKALAQRLLTGKQRFPEFKNNERKTVSLGNILKESRVPDLENDPQKRLTVRLHLKGVEPRSVSGNEAEGATAYFRRQAGQFVYGKQNLYRGALGVIPQELDGFCSTQDIPAFDVQKGYDAAWLCHYFSRQHFYEHLEALSTGSGSKRIQPSSLFKTKVQAPSLEEQRKIARALSSADREIALLTQKLEALKEQKKGLMQQLLTGKKRVKVDKKEAA